MRDSTPYPAARPSERITITNEVELEHARLQCLSPLEEDAGACADATRAKLVAEYIARIGSLDEVPVLAVPLVEIDASSVDHRAGFVLSQVDGVTSLEAILDVSGMPALDALRIVCELARRRLIVFRGKTAKKWRKRHG